MKSTSVKTKKNIILLIFFLVFSIPAFSAAKGLKNIFENPKKTPLKGPLFLEIPKIINKNLQKICPNCKCLFFVTYPQLNFLSNNKVQKSINDNLKKEFSAYKNVKCEDFFKNDSYQENTKYEIKLNEKGILSIYYFSTGFLKESAHPNSVIDSFNYSLKTGKKINKNNLFLQDDESNEKIIDLINISLNKQKIDLEFEPENYKFDFYLTSTKIVFINLFEVHAAQGIEAPINYSEIKSILAKNSPLMELLKK